MRRTRALFGMVGSFLGLSAVAGLSLGQLPLYSGNQNQYFVHGLARAGLGFLQDDWFARTVDYTPVFSVLIAVTYRYGHETLFYLYHMLMVGLYAYGLLGIVAFALHAHDSRLKRSVILAVVIMIHSAALGAITERILHVNSLYLLSHGVALQFIPGDVLQPSLFGVLLVLSVRTFLHGRRYLAVLLAALAATIHPTYLLAVGVLGSSYVYEEFRSTRRLAEAGRLALCAIVLLLPIVAYVSVSFRPTSPDAYALAGHILTDVRNPHHALLARWLGPAAFVKIMLVLGATFLIRRTRLLTVLAFSLLAAVGLTVAQVLSRSSTLALVFPWRLSVYLVPIAASIILAHLAIRVVDAVARTRERAQGLVAAAAGFAVLAAMLGGLAVMKRDFERLAEEPSMPMMGFVAGTKARGDVYLIPVGLEMFRLRTGAPIFVDWKAVPLKDADVLEWYRRFRLAERVYGLAGEEACRLLVGTAGAYGITHVVVKGSGVPSGCVQRLYDDGNYGVYRLVRKP